MSKKTKLTKKLKELLPAGYFTEGELKRLDSRVSKMVLVAKEKDVREAKMTLDRMSERDAFHAQSKFVMPAQGVKEKDKDFAKRCDEAKKEHKQRCADLVKTSRLASNLSRRALEGEFIKRDKDKSEGDK